jgi:FKBP-type peptidyl-prolyl cis-trans isomerase FkpA
MGLFPKKIGNLPELALFPVLLLILYSCGQEPLPASSTSHFRIMDDSVINYNKGVVTKEDLQIQDFINRYGWKMTETPTGLRYLIYKRNNGQKAEAGKIATIAFSIRLLNGNLCYSSGSEGPKKFKIGHSEVESGLDEGILLLKVGERAKFILPSHLAFGLLGDQNKIPQNATLVYDVELLEVK